MKIIRLDLKAFGHFTDRSLDFQTDSPGLHIIFGANEAGKSTSLRALKALLYGFPERSNDNYRHPGNQLLVGGCLQNRSGALLDFQRRKKRRADIVDTTGKPLDPAVLAAFLGDVDQALFARLYALDHPGLVQGGLDILDQKGEIGQALFAAGTGITSLQKIIATLQAEADELYKARGSKQIINLAVKDYHEGKSLLRSYSLSASKWTEHQQRHRDAEQRLQALIEEKKSRIAELNRLERLQRIIPELALLDKLQAERQALGTVIRLPTDFASRSQELRQQITAASLKQQLASDRLGQLHQLQQGISVNQRLLDLGEAIEDLHQRLGAYRKGREDRSRLEGMRISHRQEAAALLQQLRPDLDLHGAEDLRPVLTKQKTIQSLCSKHETIVARMTLATRQRDETGRNINQAMSELATLIEPQPLAELQRLCRTARQIGDIDEQISRGSQEIAASHDQCQRQLARLGLWQGTMADLQTAALPLAETIRRFADQFLAMDQQEQQLALARQRTSEQLRDCQAAQRELEYAGEIPKLADLESSRRRRQQLWQTLQGRWLENTGLMPKTTSLAPDMELHSAYEGSVAQADIIADRLRWEAERVAAAAGLQAKAENLAGAATAQAGQQEQLKQARAELSRRWLELWQPLAMAPLAPTEMLDWLGEVGKLRFQLEELSRRQEGLAEKEAERARHVQGLRQEMTRQGQILTTPSALLQPLLIAGEQTLEAAGRSATARQRLLDTIAENRRHQARAEADSAALGLEMAQWQVNWRQALSSLAITELSHPSEALDLLEITRSIFAHLDEAKTLQSRIHGIDRDAASFETDARRLMTESDCPELVALALDEAVRQFQKLLTTARHAHQLRQKSAAEYQTLALELTEANASLALCEGQRQELMGQAGCATDRDLEVAISTSARLDRLLDQIGTAENALARLCDGIPLLEIRQQIEAVQVDQLAALSEGLRDEIDGRIEPLIQANLKTIGEENRELQMMDGGAKAAETAEKMAETAARIERHVEQYLQLKLAARLLSDEIERYREQHQDPLLQLAAGIFATLTGGSFADLAADVNDQGVPTIVGIRPDGARIGVEGMSSGTCDQLYLALRLASLRWRLDTHEPMPLIIDDILINFDDNRAQSCLQVLAELASLNQVILFTHHRQITLAARTLANHDNVYIYEL